MQWIAGSLIVAILLTCLFVQMSDRAPTAAEFRREAAQASPNDSSSQAAARFEPDRHEGQAAREQAEVGAIPPEPESSRPLTVSERVAAIMKESYERPRLPKHSQFRSETTVGTLTMDPQVNPLRKSLTAEQTAELEVIVAAYTEARKKVHGEWRTANHEASTRALNAGQYIARPRGETYEAEHASIEAMKKELSQRLGTELVDWRCLQVMTGRQGDEPPLTALVWYTAIAEPLAFDRAAELGRSFEALRARARAMFESR